MRNRIRPLALAGWLLTFGLVISPSVRAAGAHLTYSINERGERVYVNDPAPEPQSSSTARPAVRRGQRTRGAASVPAAVSAAKVHPAQPPSNTAAHAGGSDVHQLIENAADRFQLDPDLIEAVVQVESGFNPHAQSSKGAQGLMQLLPATAARFGVENSFDPAENIDGGSSYLSYLLNLFNGDVSLSLAAYNAGEGAVMRYGGIPPFTETQNYVRRVSGLYLGGASDGLPAASKALRGGARSSGALRAVPVYSYVDSGGVVHFEQ